MDWDYLLNASSEINEAISFIKLFQESGIFNPSIYSAVNSVSEMHKKCIFIDIQTFYLYDFLYGKRKIRSDIWRNVNRK